MSGNVSFCSSMATTGFISKFESEGTFMEHPELYVRKDECAKHREDINKRLARGSADFAVIKTKLNAILWGLGIIGAAVAGVLADLIFSK